MTGIQKWRQIASKRVLDHKRLAIDEDIVELPTGERVSYVLHAPTNVHSVIMIAINDKNEILVQREYSYPPDEVMWQLPGGAMEAGESVKEAANRELAEESGFRAQNLEEIGYFYVNNRKSNRKQYIVVCTNLEEHKLTEDSDEFIETHWLSVSKVRKMIARGKFTNINLLASLNQWFHQDSNHSV